MSTTAPEFVTANRSHFTQEPSYRTRAAGIPCDKEELYPIVRVTMPRVGTVRAEFSADRYVYSGTDNGATMGQWRIVLRNVRNDDDEAREASGIGPVTHGAISAACEPLIVEYLKSDEYRQSLKRALAYMVRRHIIDAGTTDYGLKGSRELLDHLSTHIEGGDFSRMDAALSALATAGAFLDEVGK